MKIVAIADIHERKISNPSFLEKCKSADLILIAGDITHFGAFSQAHQTLEPFLSLHVPTYAVTGNCDYPGVMEYLNQKKISLSTDKTLFKDFEIFGLHGSLPCPGTTPQEYSEENYKLQLHAFGIVSVPAAKQILVSHQPPFGTSIDRLKNGEYTGSKSVRKYIEEQQPFLCISGHIHEAIGSDRIGNTLLINPGAFRDGNYTELGLQNGEITSINI